MTPLEMIAEWRRGCSCAFDGHPEECQECTRALIDALERALKPAITAGEARKGTLREVSNITFSPDYLPPIGSEVRMNQDANPWGGRFKIVRYEGCTAILERLPTQTMEERILSMPFLPDGNPGAE